ncbi:hypothetical protein [Aeromicrobium yanjiei]|uniref:Uncharacterized protein n=1 Tax=Aeromicrobium yanjiei TaxID=2662028 RepID=A0A5Q2MIG8_9ACTN|nr:hypothetical protein [Aeromicrobium yanjiei]QGG41463.1 hypothetical protein GEV26_08855 [Aeromicrobium yanjiei]
MPDRSQQNQQTRLLARVPIWLPAVLAAGVFFGGIVVSLVVAVTGHADGFPAKTFGAGSMLLSLVLAMSTVLVHRARRQSAAAVSGHPPHPSPGVND